MNLRYQVEFDETQDSVWMRRITGRMDWDDALKVYGRLLDSERGSAGVYQYGRTTWADGSVRNVAIRDLQTDGFE